MVMKKLAILFLLSIITITTIAQQKKGVANPDWIKQGNIYEVNVRQYTNEGTFNAFAKHLLRLKKMGVQTLWFMPITPISKYDRKGTLGSYYAASDYTAINPEYGTMADWKKLVKQIHKLGMKVITDWVPNHTGADHGWLERHPDFYKKDANGKAAVAFDWSDVRQLDYANIEMQDSMIASMKFWIVNTGIDGFRCDVAGEVPGTFWSKCTKELKKVRKDIFMLAEGDKPFLAESGFNAVYTWPMFQMMKKVAAGDSPAYALDSILRTTNKDFPTNTIQMYFTSNHDENSWNKSDFGTFPGAKHAPFAVFTQTMFKTVPLIYSGQEEPVLRAIEFFEKDPMEFKNFKRQAFYKTLLNLRTTNAALACDASFRKVNVGNEKALYAYVREKGGKKVFVILNFSGKAQTVTVKDKTLLGTPYNLFAGNNQPLTEAPWKMEPWGYVVYSY